MIGKEGVNVNPEFFGSNPEDYKKNFSTLHFKFIISPENQTVDPKLLTECFIHHLEELTGYKFYWLGCVHTDTNHNHAHLAINGIDKYGRKVRFPKMMIQISMREILSIIATRMIGERSEEEIKKQMKKMIQAKRWTFYDDELIQKTEKLYINSLDSSLVKRLQFLSSIGLAKKIDFTYVLHSDFENVLKASSRYCLYLEEYFKSDLPLKLFEGGNITCKVDKVISFDKDESWNDAVIIRTDCERVYVPASQRKSCR